MTLRHYATPVLFLAACGATTDPTDRSVAQTLCAGDVTCPDCLKRIADGYSWRDRRAEAEHSARTSAGLRRMWERRRKAGAV